LKLAKPIAIPVRQNIQVVAEFFAVGSANIITAGTGINSGRDATDETSIIFMIDGIRTREVL